MAVIFLLGPGMWGPERASAGGPSPLAIRREMARVFSKDGHRLILMEGEKDRRGEDLIQKFDGLLRNRVTDIVLYWPILASLESGSHKVETMVGSFRSSDKWLLKALRPPTLRQNRNWKREGLLSCTEEVRR